MACDDKAASASGWIKGPLPKDTFNWGAVSLWGQNGKTQAGFHFADFRGDHAMVYGDDGKMSRKIYPHEIAYYNNGICQTPKD